VADHEPRIARRERAATQGTADHDLEGRKARQVRQSDRREKRQVGDLRETLDVQAHAAAFHATVTTKAGIVNANAMKDLLTREPVRPP
jgi:hypothetical protein